MKRNFTKYFLLIFTLLIGLHGQADAAILTGVDKNVSIDFSIGEELDNLNLAINSQDFQYRKASSPSENSFDFEAIKDEVEEFEWISLKKYLETYCNKSTALFYAIFSPYFFKKSDNFSQFKVDNLNDTLLTPLYITFCVYRL